VPPKGVDTMARMGYIYLITNKINNEKYVGQTSRDIDTRFAEHCSETKGHSRLHSAIQQYGWQNFSIKEIESVPVEQLDEREQYWISYYNTCEEGYNTKIQDNIYCWYPVIKVLENNIVVSTKDYLLELLEKTTSWKKAHIEKLLNRALTEGKDFLGYHLQKVTIQSSDYLSDENCIIDWIKTLNIRFNGKHILCLELDKEFDTAASAAKFLVEHKYMNVSIQYLTLAINYHLKDKMDILTDLGLLHFIYVPGKLEEID
jgi:group I intron endonuclease